MANGFLRLCRLPLVVHGREHIPASGPFVMAVNHASYLDGLFLLAALPERGYSFAAKRELSQSLLPRLFLQAIGTDFVERSDRQARRGGRVAAGRVGARRARAHFLRRRHVHPHRGLLPFRMGAFVVAAQPACRSCR